MKIRTKHLLLLIGPLLAVMSLYAYVSISKERESRLKEVQTQAMVLAQGLRVTLEDRLLEGRPEEMKAIAEQIRDKTRLFRISIFDQEGRPLAGFPIYNEKANERPKGLEMVLKGGEEQSGLEDISGQKVFSYWIPLRGKRDEVLGALQISVPIFYLDRIMAEERNRALLTIVAMTIVLVLAISYSIRRSISRPFERLIQGAVALGGGDLKHRIPVSGNDEISVLAKEFNRMAANLEKAQEQILLDKENMLNVVDSITNGIIVVDREGRITTWNRAMEHMYDLPASEMVGRVFLETFPVLYQEGAAQALLDLLGGGSESFHFWGFEHQTLKKGRVIQNFSGYPLRGPDGQLLGAVMVIEDVTATVALERQVQQSEKLAVIGQLAAGIAHQIGTPLNVISGSAEYLMAEFKGESAKVEELQVIISQADRITRLIRQLLDFARPAKLELGEININDILKGVLRLTEPQISKERIQVKAELEEGLPFISGDLNQLEQAFLNIIVNAWQAMPDGGALTIKTRGQATHPLDGYPGVRSQGCSGSLQPIAYPISLDTDFVEVSIADTGCGIPPENLPHIFSPFFSTKELRKGTGLGLAISQRIIQDHQGTIEVESQLGNGTIFTIKFPKMKEGSSG